MHSPYFILNCFIMLPQKNKWRSVVTVLVLLSFGNVLPAQTLATKITSDLKKLSGEYLTDFKNIKGGLKYETEFESVFYSRLKLNGAVDSTNLIHFSKETEQWKFTADMDQSQTSIPVLDTIIRSASFSFGILRTMPLGDNWIFAYTPEDKKGLTEKLRWLYIMLIDNEKNPRNKSNTQLSFVFGQDINYRAK